MLHRLQQRLNSKLAPLRRRLTTRHLHGPKRVDLSPDQVMLVALVRDAAWFLPHFLDHHFDLGVAHILVIDNGSRDDSIEICKSRQNLTLLSNPLPAKFHESGLRAELAQMVARGGWLLFADSDELIETPVPLGALTHWCNQHGYTAVLGQMLDRFAAPDTRSLGGGAGISYPAAVALMDHYSLAGLRAIDYHDRAQLPFHWFLKDNLCQNSKGRLKQGGIRHALFGEDPFLSKHSLIRNQPGLNPMSHPHCASHVRVADVDLLVQHYKFAGDWQARDARALREAHWSHGEDAKRLAGGGVVTPPSEALAWSGVKTLQKEGFLHASPAFLAAHSDLAAPQ